MEQTGEKDKMRAYGKLFQCAVSMLVCLAILLYCAFAWFSQSRLITATGMSVRLAEAASLIVRAKSGAALEAVTLDEVQTADDIQRLFHMTISAEKISPGISGSFTAYVTASGTNKITIQPTVGVGRVTVTQAGGNTVVVTDENGGYRDDTTAAARTAALDYMQGHILLFSGYENGAYSGWLNPFEPTEITVTDGTETAVPVYWLWIDSYSKLSEANSVLAEDTRQEIYNYFTDPENRLAENGNERKHLLDPRSNSINDLTEDKLSHFYDFADEDIGMAVKYTYFDLIFRPAG